MNAHTTIDPPQCLQDYGRTPAEISRGHALDDALKAYWSGRNRLLIEYHHATEDIHRRFEAGEFA